MPLVEIHVDRFTTVRRPSEVKKRIVLPEYRRDVQLGAPQTDTLEKANIQPNEIDPNHFKPITARTKSGRIIYRCRFCDLKSEDRKLVRKHIQVHKKTGIKVQA